MFVVTRWGKYNAVTSTPARSPKPSETVPLAAAASPCLAPKARPIVPREPKYIVWRELHVYVYTYIYIYTKYTKCIKYTKYTLFIKYELWKFDIVKYIYFFEFSEVYFFVEMYLCSLVCFVL